MPASKLAQVAANERRLKVAQLYVQGLTQYEIAKQTKVSEATISIDLKKIQELWIAAAVVDFDQRKAVELAKIDQLERTYWEGYERSLKPFTSTKIESVWRWKRDEDGNVTEEREVIPGKETKETKKRDGDTKWLEGVERCITLRCRLVGLLKQDQNNVNFINIDWNNLFSAARATSEGDFIEDQIKALESLGEVEGATVAPPAPSLNGETHEGD